MKIVPILAAALMGLSLAACSTTEERVGGAVVGAAVAGPIGAGVGAAVAPEVVD